LKLIIFFLSSLVLLSCKAQKRPALPIAADNNSLLWEISGKNPGKTSYIFGTFHLMCKEDIRFSENLKAALHGSDEVYFEMDLDDPANTLGAMFFMNMRGDTTLKDLFTDKEYARLESFFRDSLKMSISFMNKMKPMMLEALMYPKLMPCKNMSGIEQELMGLAMKEKKEIKGFETIEFQASVFDSIPYKEQAKDLLKNIDSMASYKVYFDSMLYVYKTQQLERIGSMMNDSSFGGAEDQEILLDKRNRNWVKQLDSLLPEKSLFIAVGAGHLPGKNGVLELLRKNGYTVKPVANK
jgi:uncharacterized protein YbaP (TraB family)